MVESSWKFLVVRLLRQVEPSYSPLSFNEPVVTSIVVPTFTFFLLSQLCAIKIHLDAFNGWQALQRMRGKVR